MELSRNSALVKFIKAVTGETPKDICSFMSNLLWAFLGTTVKYGFITIAIFSPIFALITYYYTGEIDFGGYGGVPLYALLGMLGLFVWTAVLSFLVFCCVSLFIDRAREINIPTPGIVRTWYKGFKEKTCILITFKD